MHRTSGQGKAANEGYDAFVPLIDSGIYTCVWSGPRFASIILYMCAEFGEAESDRGDPGILPIDAVGNSALLAPMSLFIEWPLLALLPGVVFLAVYRASRRGWAAAAGVAWLLYTAYEMGMRLRWLCTGECNIRVDLLLIYPLLALLSVAAIVSALRRRTTA